MYALFWKSEKEEVCINKMSANRLFSRGKTCLLLKKYNEALTDFNNLLELEPNNTFALRLRGETYLRLEKNNEEGKLI
ncbi:hypothetical protein Glove_326g39 [Diversispora epigaea]|uniref:Uncharacterized protein n=1 Tax=Diversispora epigaea TaxID=1348612 RepID=A0A397HLP0_9GLOM|nr:hypothetical protein Glove_326g39 [Diversispora epigaea]